MINEECESVNFEERKSNSLKLRKKYPEKLPIILLPYDIEVTKKKYLVPYDMNFATFVKTISSNIKIKKSEALFCLIGDILPTNTQNMIELYNQNVNKDGFLYIKLRKENTFG
mgnify:CR=1 FL=1|tara:strand:+ start:1484 stop:1822 length:339 start_codon:yes stop_codon:yes gene_type:complete